MSTAHDDIEQLLGVYALDAVNPAERALVEDHLRRCASCRREVRRHLEVAASLIEADEPPPGPPESLWERIAAEVAADRPEASGPLPRMRGAAVAATVAAALIGVIGFQSHQLSQLDDQLAASLADQARLERQLVAAPVEEIARLASSHPRAISVELEGEAGSGTVILLPDGTGFLLTHALETLDPGRTYQLWAIQAGEVISAGILGPDPGVVAFKVDPASLEGLVITAEEAGGVAVSEQPAASAWFAEA